MNRRRISSLSNPHVKRARRLKQRKAREDEGAFLVEGIQPVWQAIESGAEIDTIFIAPDLLTSESALVLAERHDAPGTNVVELSGSAFAAFSEREHPTGLAAIVRVPRPKLSDLPVEPTSVFVGVVDVANPGNLGTIVRTADAVGAAGVILVGAGTDPYHPTAVKGSTGALFAVPVVRTSFEEIGRWTRAAGISLVTTSAHAGPDLWSVEIAMPCLVLLGSEAHGLDPDILESGDVSLRIPMEGVSTSLNLGVAAGVILYEIQRRQRWPRA